MSDTIAPNDHKDVEAAVQWAVAQAKSLEIIGHGSKRALGRPMQTDATLDLAG
jgi:glycolate oxidase FAD binding subunit